MSNPTPFSSLAPATSSTEVVRRAYSLLAATLIVSAIAAWAGMGMAFPYQHPIILMLLAFAALFAVLITGSKRSPAAMPLVFLFTGLMGLSLGPLIAITLRLVNGPQIVAESILGTAAIFGALSLYAWRSRRDFSFLGGFLMVGLVVVILAGIANFFLHMPALQLSIAAAALLVFSGYILVDTSRMIRGGETNPILITVSLYLDILNVFVALLQLLSALQGDRN
ncbi:MAG: Bax inhibitor-1 family protein [Gammaproteobacteria bacterium]|nr:Bax inhibitor-1 family protein [Gammaproteobacteria bacterium]